MRTSLKLILLFLTVFFFSCENEENVTLTGATNTSQNKQSPIDPIGIGYTDVYSLHINDGINNSCERNILVFPT